MSYLLSLFQGVSITFAFLAIYTGLQAVFTPQAFSKSFGLTSKTQHAALSTLDQAVRTDVETILNEQQRLTNSYISLMGIRQLGTGVSLLALAHQGNWAAMATILALIGVLVAGTDGWYLARVDRRAGQFHAIPGLGIAALAGAVLFKSK